MQSRVRELSRKARFLLKAASLPVCDGFPRRIVAAVQSVILRLSVGRVENGRWRSLHDSLKFASDGLQKDEEEISSEAGSKTHLTSAPS